MVESDHTFHQISHCFRLIQVKILASKLWTVIGINSIFCNMASRVSKNLPDKAYE